MLQQSMDKIVSKDVAESLFLATYKQYILWREL
jgi:hypothetical protein